MFMPFRKRQDMKTDTEQDEVNLRELCANPEFAYQRIVRLQEINADLAGEVDRLWHEQVKCPNCGTEAQLTESALGVEA